MSAKMKAANEWIHANMHMPVNELIKKLNTKLIGHYRYYGIIGNYDKLEDVYKRQFKTYPTYHNYGQVLWQQTFLGSQATRINQSTHSLFHFNKISQKEIYVNDSLDKS